MELKWNRYADEKLHAADHVYRAVDVAQVTQPAANFPSRGDVLSIAWIHARR